MDETTMRASPARLCRQFLRIGIGLWLGFATTGALAADSSYPFEGTWILPQHPCVAGSMHLRTYTAKEVTSARGRCSIRRIAQGSGVYELQEDCRHEGRSAIETETIRITSPDTMLLKRQVVRLKIPRQVHYARCTIAVAATPALPATHSPGRTVVPAPDAQTKTP